MALGYQGAVCFIKYHVKDLQRRKEGVNGSTVFLDFSPLSKNEQDTSHHRLYFRHNILAGNHILAIIIFVKLKCIGHVIVSIKTYLVTSNGELLMVAKHCEKHLPLK